MARLIVMSRVKSAGIEKRTIWAAMKKGIKKSRINTQKAISMGEKMYIRNENAQVVRKINRILVVNSGTLILLSNRADLLSKSAMKKKNSTSAEYSVKIL